MPDPIVESVHIDAPPHTVFEYFVRPEAMLRWMGEWAELEATPGGAFRVDIRGVPVRGEYLEVDPPHRLRISWGHAGSDRIPPGSSVLEVRLEDAAGGTTVTISHTGLPEPEATRHASGWTYFLDRLRAVALTGTTPSADRSPGSAAAGQ